MGLGDAIPEKIDLKSLVLFFPKEIWFVIQKVEIKVKK